MATTDMRETLSGDQYSLLERINCCESGQLDLDQMTITEILLASRLVKAGLLVKYRSFFEITLEGRYIVEPEATTALWGPQGGRDATEHNHEAAAAEMRSAYRYEDDDRYQMSDAEIAWRAETAAERQRQEAERAMARGERRVCGCLVGPDGALGACAEHHAQRLAAFGQA